MAIRDFLPQFLREPREMTDQQRAALLQSSQPAQDYVLNAPTTFTIDGRDFTLNASSTDPITIRLQGGVLVAAGGMTAGQAAGYDPLRIATESEYLRTGSGGLTDNLAVLGIRPQQGGQLPARTLPTQSTLMVSDDPTQQDYVLNAPTTFTIDGRDFTLNASTENPITIRVQRGVLVAGDEMTGGQAAEFDALRIASESEYVQTGSGGLTPDNLAALGIRPQQGLAPNQSQGGQVSAGVTAAMNAPGDASPEQLDRLTALEERIKRLQAETGLVAPPEFDAGHSVFPSPEFARLHEANRQLSYIENGGREPDLAVGTVNVNEVAAITGTGITTGIGENGAMPGAPVITARPNGDIVDIASIRPYRNVLEEDLNALDGRLSRLEQDEETILQKNGQFIAEPTTGGPPAANTPRPPMLNDSDMALVSNISQFVAEPTTGGPPAANTPRPPILNDSDMALVSNISQFVTEPTTGGPPADNTPSPPPISEAGTVKDHTKHYNGDVPMIYVNAATTLSTVGMGSWTTQQRNGKVITGSMIGWKDNVPAEERGRRANGYLPTDAIPVDLSGVPANGSQVTISTTPEQQLRISATDAARSGDQGMTVNVVDASTGRAGGKVAIVVQPGEQVRIQQNQQYQGHPGNWTSVSFPDGRRLFLHSETELTVQTQRSGTLKSGEVTEQTVAQYMATASVTPGVRGLTGGIDAATGTPVSSSVNNAATAARNQPSQPVR